MDEVGLPGRLNSVDQIPVVLLVPVLYHLLQGLYQAVLEVEMQFHFELVGILMLLLH
jgi:hypothetical protein